MADITHTISVDAPIDRVYAALTTTAGIRGWWTHDAAIDDWAGGMGLFAFFDRRVLTGVLVAELSPPNRVSWQVTTSNAPGGWEGTSITFKLLADGDRTTIAFAQRDFAEPNEAFQQASGGWVHYLESLKLYLETGEGTPH